jgi:hypothetical protein
MTQPTQAPRVQLTTTLAPSALPTTSNELSISPTTSPSESNDGNYEYQAHAGGSVFRQPVFDIDADV